MSQFEQCIKKSTSDIRLTDAEKARMKSVLQSYMRFHPLPEPVTTYTVTRDWFIFLQRPIAASLVLVLVVGSGVSYAAEGALPGDALYTLKTGVNEPLKIAFAGSAEEEAEVEIELAERRIEEASALAAEDRLDEATEAKLAVALNTHAESAAVLVEEIDEEDSSTAAELSARFETRLRAREDVLAQVRERDDNENERETSVERAIRTASSRVALLRERSEVRLALAPAIGGSFEDEASGAVATMAMKAAPMALTAESADTNASATAVAEVNPEPKVERKTAERMQKAAENKLKEVRKYARKSEKAQEDLEAAEELLEEGEEYLKDDAYAAAFFSFRASLEQSERASVFFASTNILKKASDRNARSSQKSQETKDSEDERSRDEDEKDARSQSSGSSPEKEEDRREEEEKDDDEKRDSDQEDNSDSGSKDADPLLKLDLSL